MLCSVVYLFLVETQAFPGYENSMYIEKLFRYMRNTAHCVRKGFEYWFWCSKWSIHVCKMLASSVNEMKWNHVSIRYYYYLLCHEYAQAYGWKSHMSSAAVLTRLLVGSNRNVTVDANLKYAAACKFPCLFRFLFALHIHWDFVSLSCYVFFPSQYWLFFEEAFIISI